MSSAFIGVAFFVSDSPGGSSLSFVSSLNLTVVSPVSVFTEIVLVVRSTLVMVPCTLVYTEVAAGAWALAVLSVNPLKARSGRASKAEGRTIRIPSVYVSERRYVVTTAGASVKIYLRCERSRRVKNRLVFARRSFHLRRLRELPQSSQLLKNRDRFAL